MRRLRRAEKLRAFTASQDGAALLLFTIMLPVIMGLIALSVDAGRYMNLNTELQDVADAAALAGAEQLDGKLGTGASDSAVERAKTAAKAILQDTKWAAFADEVQILEPIVTEYVSENPADDLAPADSAIAHFVTVITQTRTMAGTFIRAVSATPDASTQARAVAGSTVIACKVPPLMICTPGGDLSQLPYPLEKGRLYRLKGGGGAGYDPPASGAFGLLDTPGRTSSGTNEIRTNLGRPDPNFCFLSNLSYRKGNAAAVRQAINTRFDMYEGGIASYKPAPNVIKGMVQSGSGNGCKYDLPKKNPELYRPLSKGDTETPNAAMGSYATSTTWDRAGYWSVNHPDSPTLPAAVATATRYEMYLWELGLHPQSTGPQMPTGLESGSPACNPPPASADRRVIYAAALDCSVSHTQLQLSTAYLKFFITEPATNDGDVYAEYIGKEELGGNSGVLHHIVQLYR